MKGNATARALGPSFRESPKARGRRNRLPFTRSETDATFGPTASGIPRRYSRAPFPSNEGGSLSLVSLLRFGGTSAIGGAHLEKARLLPGLENKWKAREATTVRRGLAKAGDTSPWPRPAASRKQRVKIILSEGSGDEFANIAPIGWAIFLRIPAEYLPIRRRRAAEDIASEKSG